MSKSKSSPDRKFLAKRDTQAKHCKVCNKVVYSQNKKLKCHACANKEGGRRLRERNKKLNLSELLVHYEEIQLNRKVKMCKVPLKILKKFIKKVEQEIVLNSPKPRQNLLKLKEIFGEELL